jgi:hypothetical protein
MRPVIKVALAFLVLCLLLLSYLVVEGLKRIDVAAKVARIQHDVALATMIRDACLQYITEYNHLPPFVDNKQLTSALLGNNPRHIAFLSLAPKEVNSDGEVVDRWGTPLRIIFEGASGIQVISAGPDKVFNTMDDIVSNSPAIDSKH